MHPANSLLLERARALRPVLEARAETCAAMRRVPDETIDDFVSAGFFSMLQPTRWGGLETDPNVFFDVVTELASACPSSAWVLGVVAVHAWQLALFPLEAQTEVWGKDPHTRISSSYMPVGVVTRTEGGYRLSGKWGFSSGVDHCDYLFLGAMVPSATTDGAPEMRTFLVPKRDVVIDDDWHVSGLRGTGSKSVIVTDAFVPEHRTHRMADGFRCESPGNAHNPAPLFRLPFGQIFTRTVATPAIGMLQGALDAFLETNRARQGRADGKRAADDPATQEAIAMAMLALREAKALLHHDYDAMMARVVRGERIPIEDRIAYRHHAGGVTDRMAQALDGLVMETGGSAIFTDQKINRFFQDIHAARAHHANNPRKTGRNLGSHLLGREPNDYFL